eukprot:403334724
MNQQESLAIENLIENCQHNENLQFQIFERLQYNVDQLKIQQKNLQVNVQSFSNMISFKSSNQNQYDKSDDALLIIQSKLNQMQQDLSSSSESLNQQKQLLMLTRLSKQQQLYINQLEDKYQDAVNKMKTQALSTNTIFFQGTSTINNNKLVTKKIVLDRYIDINMILIEDEKIQIVDKLSHLEKCFEGYPQIQQAVRVLQDQSQSDRLKMEEAFQNEYLMRKQLVEMQDKFIGMEEKVQQIKQEYERQLRLNFEELQIAKNLGESNHLIQETMELQLNKLHQFDRLHQNFTDQNEILFEQQNIIQKQIGQVVKQIESATQSPDKKRETLINKEYQIYLEQELNQQSQNEKLDTLRFQSIIQKTIEDLQVSTLLNSQTKKKIEQPQLKSKPVVINTKQELLNIRAQFQTLQPHTTKSTTLNQKHNNLIHFKNQSSPEQSVQQFKSTTKFRSDENSNKYPTTQNTNNYYKQNPQFQVNSNFSTLTFNNPNNQSNLNDNSTTINSQSFQTRSKSINSFVPYHILNQKIEQKAKVLVKMNSQKGIAPIIDEQNLVRDRLRNLNYEKLQEVERRQQLLQERRFVMDELLQQSRD